MKSNNNIMTCKNKSLSFMNKIGCSIIVLIPVIIFGASLYLMIRFWIEIPIIIKILLPIVSLIIFIGAIFIQFNGMFISKKVTIIFVPDLRIKKFRINEIKRMAFNFNEWKNNKYSVTIDIVCQDGKVFSKDYSTQFKNIRKNKAIMAIYAIKLNKVDRILNQMADLGFCTANIIDQCGNLVYQKK